MDHSGQQRSLPWRVPTRWNSDLTCLSAHIGFETPVRQLTSSDPSLKKYALSEAQWKLAKQLAEVLEIFYDITILFSKAEVPLVHEVIPMLEAMEHDLTVIRDSFELPVVIRIAAIAALLIISKYYALTDDNEVYRIAIGTWLGIDPFLFDKFTLRLIIFNCQSCVQTRNSSGSTIMRIGARRIVLR